MPKIQPVAKNPVAVFLTKHRTVSKIVDKDTVQFYTPDNKYLGELCKATYGNYRKICVKLFNEKLKPLYEKNVIIRRTYDKMVLNKDKRFFIPNEIATFQETTDRENSTIETKIKVKKLASELVELQKDEEIAVYGVKEDVYYTDIGNGEVKIVSQILG